MNFNRLIIMKAMSIFGEEMRLGNMFDELKYQVDLCRLVQPPLNRPNANLLDTRRNWTVQFCGKAFQEIVNILELWSNSIKTMANLALLNENWMYSWHMYTSRPITYLSDCRLYLKGTHSAHYNNSEKKKKKKKTFIQFVSPPKPLLQMAHLLTVITQIHFRMPNTKCEFVRR